jgi:high-affinity K+ transport system ATPase subunit B
MTFYLILAALFLALMWLSGNFGHVLDAIEEGRRQAKARKYRRAMDEEVARMLAERRERSYTNDAA